MTAEWLPFGSPIEAYERQASLLLAGHDAREPRALEIIHRRHPRFLDEQVVWLPRDVSAEEIAEGPFDISDARLTIARIYDYLDWRALAEHVMAMADPSTPIARFESAVEAVVDGRLGDLEVMLAAHPELLSERSRRRTCFDPSVHGATLLHYTAANGVENHRQRTPPNAEAVARLLLRLGSDPNALAHLYGGECTTLSLLVSSTPPAAAGVQVALVHALVDHGAALGPLGRGLWTAPVQTALVFGFRATAEALVSRGAVADTLPTAAGVGDLATLVRLLPGTNNDEKQMALAVATMNGALEAIRHLLAHGADPSAYQPEGHHSHATPLHHAAGRGDLAMVELLLAHGADVAAKDKLYHATPLGWAEHGGHQAIATRLRRVSPAES